MLVRKLPRRGAASAKNSAKFGNLLGAGRNVPATFMGFLMRVLLAEDDIMIGRSLERALRRTAMAVDWVRTAADCAAAVRNDGYGILLLDLALPDGSGLDVLRDLRRNNSDLAVVIITARDDVKSRIAGLDGGADDYVVKPFDFDELSARMRAVARRRLGQTSSLVMAGEVSLDLARYEVLYRGTSAVLSGKEFALVHALAERPGTILSRGQIEDRLYDWGNEVESNAVDVLIHYVRRKFDKDIIRNVRGVGWMIPAGSAGQ
jgi:DNA-binding response OmpR family regulator